MTPIMNDSTALPGFADPVFDAQSVFRALLDAMSRPGSIVDLPVAPEAPAPLLASAAALCLSLVDVDTPLWLDPALAESEAVKALLRFQCGCPITQDPAQAAFAVAADPQGLPPLDAFAQGSHAYPDRSTTLILQVSALTDGSGITLRGPGIENSRSLAVQDLAPAFWEQAKTNHARFPCGVDVVFAAPSQIAALPRSTTVET